MRTKSLAVGLTCTAIVLSGCGTLYNLQVTAHNSPNIDPGKSYVILSGNPELRVASPEFIEYANQVERALDSKGYHRVADGDLAAAALGVYVSAAISDPARRYNEVSTGMYETPYGDETGSQGRSGGSSSGGGGTSGQQSAPTAPAPELLSGIKNSSFATTVYTKHLNLVAVDLQKYISEINSVGREDAVPVEVWSVDVETTGQPSDLSEVFPVLVAASQPYLGDKTEDVVILKMSGSDKRVTQIKSAN
jgi:hypothetical protein